MRAGGRAALPSIPDKPSIAVLAFNNMSGDAEQEYFSDGISEDIITDLSKLSELHVIARNSSFVYKKAAVSVPDMAKALGVRYLLEGSVRKAGNRVRVTAQLIDSRSGGHVWASRFDRDLTDIFAVQDELTQEIVSALKLKLTASERDQLARERSVNIEAYEFLLRGREQSWLAPGPETSRRATWQGPPSLSIRHMRRPTPSSLSPMCLTTSTPGAPILRTHSRPGWSSRSKPWGWTSNNPMVTLRWAWLACGAGTLTALGWRCNRALRSRPTQSTSSC